MSQRTVRIPDPRSNGASPSPVPRETLGLLAVS
jgi:hypothetical protein